MLKAPLPANSVTTAAIQDGAVKAQNVDFTTLPGVAIFANTESSSITFTAPFDGIVEVEFSVLGWGYGGGLWTVGLSTPSGLTQVWNSIGGVQGSDSVNRQIITRALYSGVKKGTSYTISTTSVTGSPGGANNRKMMAKVYQQSA